MVSHALFAAVAALSLITLPAMAQTGAGNETSGHHYSGSPKTEVPHHMGRRRRSASQQPRASPVVTTTMVGLARRFRTIWETGNKL